MKKSIYLLLVLILSVFSTSCSQDDQARLINPDLDCECYYELIEGGQLQDWYHEPSDTTDCSLDGTIIHFIPENPANYRRLKCI